MATRTPAARGPSRKRRRAPPGTAPGTLIADPEALPPVIRLMAYGPQDAVEETITDLESLPARLGAYPVTWVNVDGLGDIRTIERLGEIFSIHRLALEDAVNVHQRAKVDTYPQQLFLVVRELEMRDRVRSEQVSHFVGRNYLLTFQERPGDVFEPVRERIRAGRGRIRNAGPGYLLYELLDAVVDHYFPVLEQVGERLERLETEALDRPTRGTIGAIHDAKRDLLTLRRTIWPLREMLNAVLRDPRDFIQEEDRAYFRDCYDHAIQVLDLVENYRELSSGLTDVYLSSVSNRMNEVMKVLTIFASIFIPLTLIAGIYGMNFDRQRSPWNMPELGWAWGYPFSLGLMLATALGLLLYFRRKGWLGSERSPGRARRSGERPPRDPTPGV